MKDRTSNYLVFVLPLFFAYAACGCVDSVDTDIKNLIGRWRMSKVIHQGKTILKPDVPGYYSETEIEFLENGEIKGTLPMEEFAGNYEAFGEDSVSIRCWKSSKKGVTEWGGYFYYNINLVSTFSLKRKGLNFRYGELYLNYDDGILMFDRIK